MTELVGKRLLVVSADPVRAASLRDVLSRAGLEVTVTLTPAEALLALEQLPQDILLIDGRFGEPFPDAFPRLKLQHRGEPIRDVLLIDPPRGPALTHWLKVMSSHGVEPQTLPNSGTFQIVDELAAALASAPVAPSSSSIVGASNAPLHPAGMPPQPEALHFLLGVWARRHTGLLEMPLMGLSARLIGGEPATPGDLPVLVQAMYVGGATFSPSARQHDPVQPVLGAHLWEAGQRLANPEAVLERMSSLLVERSAGRRAKDLPLPEDLLTMLAARRGRTSLLGLCASAGVAPSQIAAPLSALVRMGLFSLRQAPGVAVQEEPPSLLPALDEPKASLPPERSPFHMDSSQRTHRFSDPAPRQAEPARAAPEERPSQASADRAWSRPTMERSQQSAASVERSSSVDRRATVERPHSASRSAERAPLRDRLREKSTPRARARRSSPEANAALLKRLQREWELIEIADDWTTLGIPADSPTSLVARAVDRLERRYGALTEADAATPEIQEIAERILERVRSAGAAVRKGEQRTPGEAQPEAAFREGVRALERGSFSHAARWFQSARQSDPRNAVYNGYLGWAVYNDPSLPREGRRKKGFELLQLAEVTAEPVPELQYFLAKVESQEGELPRARARLRRLLKQKPGYTAARRALEALPSDPPTE